MKNRIVFFLATRLRTLCVFVLLLSDVEGRSMSVHAEETKVAVTFSGGYDTEKKDGGRPIVLIAAGLGVKPEVFREAFSGVTPARDGKPTGDQARTNKVALMKVLKPHGVTNERLDEVSDYYRYQPQKGGLWKTKAAKGHAIFENGTVKKIVITEAGAGYSSAPKVTVDGMENILLKATVKFDTDLKKNGSISSIDVISPSPSKPEK